MASPDSTRRETYLGHLIEGRRARCQAIVEDLLDAESSLRELYVDLFQDSLYRVGTLWERGKISVATEHLATAITQRMMNLAYPRLFRATLSGRRALVACAADEYHQLGGQMVADLFELRGWDCDFLGADTPVSDLVQLIEQRQPEVVGLSISVYFNLPPLLAAIDGVRAVDEALPILVGGQALRFGDLHPVAERPGVTIVRDWQQLEAWLDAQ